MLIYITATAVTVAGIYPPFLRNVTWISVNLAGDQKRAAGMALHIGLGNLAGAMASDCYRPQDAPRYVLGHAPELGFDVAGLVAVFILWFSYQRINCWREQMDISQLDTYEMAN